MGWISLLSVNIKLDTCVHQFCECCPFGLLGEVFFSSSAFTVPCIPKLVSAARLQQSPARIFWWPLVKTRVLISSQWGPGPRAISESHTDVVFLISAHDLPTFQSYTSHRPRKKRHHNFEGTIRLTWPVQRRTREGMMICTLLKRKI